MQRILQGLGDRNPVTNVTGIAMEHQHGEVALATARGRAEKESVEGLSIGGGDLKVFEVLDAELTGAWNVCSRIDGDIAGVYQFAG